MISKPELRLDVTQDRALTYQQAAEIAHVSMKTVRAWPVKRIRLGHRTVRIMMSDLLAYLKERAA